MGTLYVVPLFVMVKTRNNRILLTGKLKSNVWYIHTMEYNSTIKLSELSVYAVT